MDNAKYQAAWRIWILISQEGETQQNFASNNELDYKIVRDPIASDSTNNARTAAVEGRNLPGYNRVNLIRILVQQNEDENSAPRKKGVVIHKWRFYVELGLI